MILDLLPDGRVIQSDRSRAVVPANAKRSDVRRIIEIAEKHGPELLALWESVHGKQSE